MAYGQGVRGVRGVRVKSRPGFLGFQAALGGLYFCPENEGRGVIFIVVFLQRVKNLSKFRV